MYYNSGGGGGGWECRKENTCIGSKVGWVATHLVLTQESTAFSFFLSHKCIFIIKSKFEALFYDGDASLLSTNILIQMLTSGGRGVLVRADHPWWSSLHNPVKNFCLVQIIHSYHCKLVRPRQSWWATASLLIKRSHAFQNRAFLTKLQKFWLGFFEFWYYRTSYECCSKKMLLEVLKSSSCDSSKWMRIFNHWA